MQRFDELHDPLAERISDNELREILQRLGEAEFGGDERATVGAVVEATGADAATILRFLGEIRQRSLDDQRKAMTAMERRVARLESRPAEVPTHVVYREAEARSEGSKAVSTAFVFALVCIALILFLIVLSSPPRHSFTEGATYSTEVHDGTLVLGPDGEPKVKLRDGGTRQPTSEEKGLAYSLASAMSPSR